MTWKGVGSSPSVNVVKNLKDYINLLLGYAFEHVLAKFFPSPCWIIVKCVNGKLEALRLTQFSCNLLDRLNS